jgi:outer membrane lipoprotein-sorting protein
LTVFTRSPGAPGDEVRQITKTREALNRIKPFKVVFLQQVFTEDNDNPDIQESGEIIFKDDHQLKWTYLEPDYKVFLLSGDTYRFYDRDNEQLIIGKITDRSQQWVWQLLFSDRLFRDFSLSWDETGKAIHIKGDPGSAPGSAHAGDGQVDIEVTVDNDSLPVKVLQRDPTGARIVYYFKTYYPRLEIPAGIFRWEVPEDTEIIRE